MAENNTENMNIERDDRNEYLTSSEFARSLHDHAIAKEKSEKKDKAYYENLEIAAQNILNNVDCKF